MNHANVLKLADRIDGLPYGEEDLDCSKRPKTFNMASACGTACCLSGWVNEIFGKQEGYAFWMDARVILELNWVQARALFTPPGYECMKAAGSSAAQVLRKMEEAGDDVDEFQIWEFWRQSWI